MDAVRFGRWLGERRRASGWASQRALAEAARADPALAALGISEAFLARVEAGQLVFPFRAETRRRMLGLARLLCQTPKDLRTYVRAAELSDLSADEQAELTRLTGLSGLSGQMAGGHPPAPLVLPPRPARLVGREEPLAELLAGLLAGSGGLWTVTGMPGVGKSALAREAAHRVAERGWSGAFPDGVLFFSLAGRRGEQGLASALGELAALLAPARRSAADETVATESAPEPERAAGPEQRARAALAGKALLLVLDDMEPAFPLRRALDTLLSGAPRPAPPGGLGGSRPPGASRCVLLTSRYLPPPGLVTHHLALPPLAPEAAQELFAGLLRRPLHPTERASVGVLCAALGHLPLALEVAATAAAAHGIPLALLAERALEHPLDGLLDREGQLRETLERALGLLDDSVRESFSLLGALESGTFGLETAAAVGHPPGLMTLDAALPRRLPAASEAVALPAAASAASARSEALASTAGDLGQLVRQSLLQALPPAAAGARDGGVWARYGLHPVLRAYAAERLEQADPERARLARQQALAYALDYVARHADNPVALEREREFLLAALAGAWRRDEHAALVRLVAGLWPVIGRLGVFEQSMRLLLWGVSAAQQLADQPHLARFLNQVGVLLYYHGETDRARQTWEASLRIAEALRQPPDLWQPLANLALLACTTGELELAARYAELYLRHGQRDDNLMSIAAALLNRGMCAGLEGDAERASADLTACARLLALRGNGSRPAHDGILALAAQAELARVQGDYARSRHHTELAVALAEELSDHYLMADLLLDQARYAQAHAHAADARLLAQRVVAVATEMEAHHLRTEGLGLLRQLPIGDVRDVGDEPGT